MTEKKIEWAREYAEEAVACRKTFRAREEQIRAERERLRQKALVEVRQAVRAVVSRYPALRRMYLFGSVIRPGAFRPDSDIDVAVEGLDMGTCFDLWRDIERAMPGWTVDVRPLAGADGFSEQVRQRGMLIYEREDSGS